MANLSYSGPLHLLRQLPLTQVSGLEGIKDLKLLLPDLLLNGQPFSMHVSVQPGIWRSLSLSLSLTGPDISDRIQIFVFLSIPKLTDDLVF